MRSVVAFVTHSSALVALLLTASCLEPARSNGEPCLSADQCESNFCRAGVCVTRPDTSDVSSLPPPVDASADVTEDVAEDATEEATIDAEPDTGDDAEPDATEDAPADVAEDAADAADDAQDAQSD
jgi:hypothetical protein